MSGKDHTVHDPVSKTKASWNIHWEIDCLSVCLSIYHLLLLMVVLIGIYVYMFL